MASGLNIEGASPLIGSPITYKVRAATISGSVAFHRVKLTVHAALDGDTAYTDLTLSSPAESGEWLHFDISSALRAVADRYEYTYTPPASYPRVRYTLSACDEYMQNGEVHDNVGSTSIDTPQYCLMGHTLILKDCWRLLALSQHSILRASLTPLLKWWPSAK